MINSRSIGSILKEAETLVHMNGFRGIISGVGGPTANMYGMKCKRWDKQGTCPDKDCLYPAICSSLDTDPRASMELLTQLRKINGVRKVFVGYGIRHDLALKSPEYIELLCEHHISGRLTVAPESYDSKTTRLMRKPERAVFEEFYTLFTQTNKKLNKKQYLLPYLISGHPGCDFSDMVETAEYIRDTGLYTEQVQDFTPTPMTASTCMYHTGIDPFTGEAVNVVKGRRDKKVMRSMLHYREPGNHTLVYEGLKRACRLDLVGDNRKCLIGKRETHKRNK
jgi:uncharacterized radical SAM protein YgiQ